MNYTIKPSKDIDKLNDFFEENQLDMGEEGAPEKTKILAGWEIIDETGFVGGVQLSTCQGEYILDGIAVREELRKTKIGKDLLDKVLEEAKNVGAHRMYLVARAPEFFRKYGFKTIDPKDAPPFFGCLTCPQYNDICHPEVMLKEGL